MVGNHLTPSTRKIRTKYILNDLAWMRTQAIIFGDIMTVWYFNRILHDHTSVVRELFHAWTGLVFAGVCLYIYISVSVVITRNLDIKRTCRLTF